MQEASSACRRSHTHNHQLPYVPPPPPSDPPAEKAVRGEVYGNVKSNPGTTRCADGVPVQALLFHTLSRRPVPVPLLAPQMLPSLKAVAEKSRASATHLAASSPMESAMAAQGGNRPEDRVIFLALVVAVAVVMVERDAGCGAEFAWAGVVCMCGWGKDSWLQRRSYTGTDTLARCGHQVTVVVPSCYLAQVCAITSHAGTVRMNLRARMLSTTDYLPFLLRVDSTPLGMRRPCRPGRRCSVLLYTIIM